MTAPAPRRLLWLLAPVAAFAATLALLNAVQGGGGAAAPTVFDRPGPASVDVPPDASTAETIAATRAAIEDEPGDAALYATLGDLYYQRGRETADSIWNEKAHDAYSRALELDPQSAQATNGLGTLALAKHDFAGGLRYGAAGTGARARVRPALLRDRRRPGRARPLRRREALARPDGLAQAEPRLVRAHLLLPRAPWRPDGALQAMRLAVSAGGGSAENVAYVETLLGNLEFQAGHVARAGIAYSRPRSRACPSTCRRRPGLATVQAATGDLDGAIERYEAVVETSAVHEYHLLLLEAKLADGRADAARRDRRDPREPGARAEQRRQHGRRARDLRGRSRIGRPRRRARALRRSQGPERVVR